MGGVIVCIRVSTLPQKHPLFLSKLLPLPPQIGKLSTFFILNTIVSLKLLFEISQFEFLVMTEKNTFVYKLFLLLSISDFEIFVWKLQPYNLIFLMLLKRKQK